MLVKHLKAPEAAPAIKKMVHRYEVQGPQDLIGLPLLTHSRRPDLWPRWFAENAIEADVLVSSKLLLEQITMILEAALADLGAALLPRLLIRRELERQELVALPGLPLQVNEGFFFVYAEHRESYPPLAQFRDWLLNVFDS